MTTSSTSTTVATTTSAPLGQEHLRPRMHFTAADTWLNDPNGLLYHKGVYHLFFQNNPEGSTWGNMSWGHATSTDLVTWSEQPVALRYTEAELVFSGSAVVDVDNTAGFAGPGETALVAIYTSVATPGSPRPGIQSQSLAYSLDDGATWTRYAGNPVLDIGSTEFRDPKVFWHGDTGGHWVMVIVKPVDHRVAFYTSPNLRDWTLASTFGPAHAVGGVWECPDLFPLRIEGTDETRWVLVVSLNPGAIAGGSGTQYFVGDFDGTTFTPDQLSHSEDPRSFDWLDHGPDHYAAVSFSNVPDGRRLMVGWSSNWEYANRTPTHPWRSSMSLVREVDLVRTGDGHLRVRQRPVLPDEAAASIIVHYLTVPAGPGDRTCVVLSTPSGESHVVITVDGGEQAVSSDRTRSGQVDFHPTFPSVDTAPMLGAADTTDLRIVVDGCVLEVYVDGGLATITQLVFPDAPMSEVRVLHDQKAGRSE